MGLPQCPICLCDMTDKIACFSKCGHVYHHGCASQWMSGGGKKNCPQCNKKGSLTRLYLELGSNDSNNKIESNANADLVDYSKYAKLLLELNTIKTEYKELKLCEAEHKDNANELKDAQTRNRLMKSMIDQTSEDFDTLQRENAIQSKELISQAKLLQQKEEQVKHAKTDMREGERAKRASLLEDEHNRGL